MYTCVPRTLLLLAHISASPFLSPNFLTFLVLHFSYPFSSFFLSFSYLVFSPFLACLVFFLFYLLSFLSHLPFLHSSFYLICFLLLSPFVAPLFFLSYIRPFYNFTYSSLLFPLLLYLSRSPLPLNSLFFSTAISCLFRWFLSPILFVSYTSHSFSPPPLAPPPTRLKSECNPKRVSSPNIMKAGATRGHNQNR
jgi:hypothetical protein